MKKKGKSKGETQKKRTNNDDGKRKDVDKNKMKDNRALMIV